jgi:hypothetical protein
MHITLSPGNVTPITADFNGKEETIEILNFTRAQQEEYEAIVDKSIENEQTIGDFYEERWDYAIKSCTVENPFDVMPMKDIKTILQAVNTVNYGVDEKKS